MTNNRIEWLDYMKGVAILIVVVGHVAHDVRDSYHFTRPIIICEMPLFFMLSGILANRVTLRTVGENFKKKILSLGIPLVVVGTTYALFSGSMYCFLFNLYHMGFWFLLSLLTCWLMFIPLLKFIKYVFRDKSVIVARLGELLLFIPFVIYKFLRGYLPESVDEALSLNFTFTYYRFFVIGYFVGVYYPQIKSNIYLWLSAVATFTMLFFTLSDAPILSIIPMTIQQLILSLCLSATIYICYKYSFVFIKKFLIRYGKDSLAIYMFHIILLPYTNLHFLQGLSEMVAFGGILFVSFIICELILLVSYPIKHNKYLRKAVLGKF